MAKPTAPADAAPRPSDAGPGPAWPPTLGLLLAGGLARRMGGGDKGLRSVGGVPLLERAAQRLAPHCTAGMVLNANGDPARFARFGWPVVADPVEGNPGPLAGILAGLDWAAQHHPDVAWVASTPTDQPFLPRDLVPRLHAARIAGGTPLACAATEGAEGLQTHPPIALWLVALREDLRAALAAGERKIDRWTASHGVAVASWPDTPFDPFLNANTEADLADAEAVLAAHPGA